LFSRRENKFTNNHSKTLEKGNKPQNPTNGTRKPAFSSFSKAFGEVWKILFRQGTATATGGACFRREAFITRRVAYLCTSRLVREVKKVQIREKRQGTSLPFFFLKSLTFPFSGYVWNLILF